MPSNTLGQIWKYKLKLPVCEKPISGPPLTPSPTPSPWLALRWLTFHPGDLWLVQAAARRPGAPGSVFGRQRRTTAPLLCCLVRRAAEGSGVCASFCVSKQQQQRQQRCACSPPEPQASRGAAVHASDTRRRRIPLSSSSIFWLIET